MKIIPNESGGFKVIPSAPWCLVPPSAVSRHNLAPLGGGKMEERQCCDRWPRGQGADGHSLGSYLQHRLSARGIGNSKDIYDWARILCCDSLSGERARTVGGESKEIPKF